MSAVHVRPARPDERARIAELTLDVYGEYAHTMHPEAWGALEGAVHASLASEEGVTRLVAELDGSIVGSAALYDPRVEAYGSLASGAPWPEVRLVAVSPAARRHGVARALVRECARRARHAGARQLGLHTSRSMPAAIRLYEEMGFVRDPARDFHPPGAELVEGYRLDLSYLEPTTEH
ncbi:MAG: GNAT family N-acetyltransferase [bacterium]